MRSRITAVLGLMLLFMVGLVPPANATFPGKNGKITYSADGIHAINPDGTGLVTLIDDPLASDLAWSADGTKIAFVRYDESFSSASVYVARADGSDLARVTSGPYVDTEPAWSPDGLRIAYVRATSRNTTEGHIHVVDVNGGSDRDLTNDPDSYQRDPDWSPDGTKIAFTAPSASCGRPSIWTMNPDGSGKVQLTTDDMAKWVREAPCSTGDGGPSWSPDSQRIAFNHVRADSPITPRGALAFIYAINRDGSNPVALTYSGEACCIQPVVWSPDGTRIAWVAYYQYLFTVDATGGSPPDDSDAPDIGEPIQGTTTFVHKPNWQPIPEPTRSDYKNVAKFCEADRAFLGASAFADKYERNRNASSAYGKCVSRNA